MKKLLAAFVLLISMHTQAQTGWTITSGGSSIPVKNSDETIPVYINKEFKIEYKTEKPEADWNRSVMFNDESDNEILRQSFNTDNGALLIDGNSMLQYFKQKSKIIIYTISIPKDPAQAAAVRVRRVKVCTIVPGDPSTIAPAKKTKATKKKSKPISKKP